MQNLNWLPEIQGRLFLQFCVLHLSHFSLHFTRTRLEEWGEETNLLLKCWRDDRQLQRETLIKVR